MNRSAVTFAKTLRRHSTDAESLLWRYLRGHRFAGWKFKRQQPIGPYIDLPLSPGPSPTRGEGRYDEPRP